MKGLDTNQPPFLFFQNNGDDDMFRKEVKNSLLNQTPETETKLSQVFFSKDNMNIVNKGIVLAVYKITNGKFKISQQSEQDLLIAMTYFYDNYSKNLPYNIDKQVATLNNLVIKNLLPDIITNLEQYIGYLRDASRLPDPLPPPINVNNLDRTLPSVTTRFE